MEKVTHPVVVIGCGASGVSALHKLKKAGIPVIGVEANDRIGGRILSVEFAGHIVDLGATWCHGEKNNKVFEVAGPLGLLGRPQKVEGADPDLYVFSDGSLMPTENGNAIYAAIQEYVKKNVTKDGSISELVRNGVNTISESIIPKPLPISEPFLTLYERDNHLDGELDPAKGKALSEIRQQEVCTGEFWLHWQGRGYKTFLDTLLNPPGEAPLNVEIQYNKVVKNISWNSDKSKAPTVLITFEDGTTLTASHVIVTIPLALLKLNYKTLFTPSLPENKIAAINHLQCCLLNKIYLEFEKTWWPKGLVNFKILWREEDKALFADQKWVTGIYGLRSVAHEPRVLLAWLNGPLAEEMEKATDEEVSQGIRKLLKHVFSVKYEVPEVLNIKRSKWASNPFARASYSYRAVTSDNHSASSMVLSEPLLVDGKPVVCFAGEATSHRFQGNVHGAVDAGFREAERIIAALAK